MKIKYKEPKDNRINAKRPFWKEFLIIWGVMLVCCTGAVLIFNQQLLIHDNPWKMVLANGSYVIFMGFLVSLITRWLSYTAFTRPIIGVRQAARRVASGDFTVRVHSQRKDDKKDELEVLIDDFNKMVEELATIETLKSDFIANISHEIKTPLAIIQSYAFGLRKDELSKDKKQEYIETILEASQKLATLVSDILRLNKLESQEIVKKETYSLDEQLRCCILALEDRFNDKNLELMIDLEEVTVTTDENLLEIVWNNLLTNAIKFTEPSGSVSVELKVIEGKALVKIRDTGCGMSEEISRHVFDRFYQGDTSHSAEGNGLGLALVRRIIDLIEGDIRVDSEVGKGTTFSVTIHL
jgi:signal transduction histidine kinase